ncbi:acyltransferase [Rhodanobacter sp. FW510-R12]|uniref:acyltransferase n=1 Tax=unclassified Rhodanobacter TaxID=2621553 RepID=UPI0007A9DD45|nr:MULTISPECIES: acyltransferase [unclassified Rhodanobacter]KZC16487.1 acyltransferase [Rhodanobacter sp. FW104-R8]KZC28855.1 acyltransferase [Rhodanobacter sp. FW510-T8]KZC31501.1 acyltransferase [Rhodanobacter sp. FW510-R10]
MLAKLPGLIRIPLALLLLAGNIVLHVLPLFAFTLVKLVVPVPAIRQACSRVLVRIAESWIGVNGFLFDLFTRIRWRVEGLAGLRRDGNYLVLCNHQSWVDIPVLQRVFNRRIPFLRFFLKQQLIWVPLLGQAWWALDFPFMKRYSRETLLKHPELQGKDKEATRRACEKFRHMPVSVMNFVEGTRFTPAKHAAQSSPYRHLLRPKAGGLAFVLDAMGDALHAILDVTIVYPEGRCTMADLIAGRVRDIRVHVRERAIEAGLLGNYDEDAAFRGRVKSWVNTLWREKDAQVASMLMAADAAPTGN